MSASDFSGLATDADITVAPLSGIGQKALLETMNPDGRNPAVCFAAGGGYYVLTVVFSRSEMGAANAPQETSAEKTLAKLLAAQMSS